MCDADFDALSWAWSSSQMSGGGWVLSWRHLDLLPRPSIGVAEAVLWGPCGMVGTRLCRGGFAPPTQDVWFWCHRHHCVPFDVDQAVLALTSGGRSKFLGEWASTGWCCCGCVLAPLSIEHIKCTIQALAATPLQFEWEWSFTSSMSFMWSSSTQSHVSNCIPVVSTL